MMSCIFIDYSFSILANLEILSNIVLMIYFKQTSPILSTEMLAFPEANKHLWY